MKRTMEHAEGEVEPSKRELSDGHSNDVDSARSVDATDPRLTLFDAHEQRKIMLRVDRRLVTTLGLMYCISVIDRSNLGLASIGGMTVDLELVGSRYSIISLVFFITYVLLQPVATVVLRKVGPRLFLPTIAISWGVTMIGFGFVREWYQLIPLRLVLGIFEAGLFPGAAYLLSCWYPRYEVAKRNAAFYLMGSIATGFAGILAYGLIQMNGVGSGHTYLGQHYGPTTENPNAPVGQQSGIAGWRWLFIIEGILTCLIGLASYYLVVDFPEKAARSLGFLNEAEASFVVARIENDRSDAIPEVFSVKEYIRAAADSKVWAFAWLFGLCTTTAYAISIFLPIILQEELGFDTGKAQCLIAPPYVAASIVMYCEGWISDRIRLRGVFVAFNALLTVIGLALLGFHRNSAVRYFGVFLATIGANANIPSILTYQANNIRGQWKRALCSATLVGSGGIGGIIGATVFRTQDKPGYVPGITTGILAGVLLMLITGLLTVKFHRANKRADNGGKLIEGLVGFRYTL